MKQTAVVIIPTYNEAESIGTMLQQLITQTFQTIMNWDMKVLVVDGNSVDGTQSIVQQYVDRVSNVHLLVEKNKEGIGAAYLKGFAYATQNLKADVLIEFDGDFQHPTDCIPLLMEQIDNGADLVIGSRCIKGGSYPKGWGFRRRFLSQIGGLVARFILFFPRKAFFTITDPTTGLKATRVDMLYRGLDISRVRSKSFAYKLEMLHQYVMQGAEVREIPLPFGLRQGGESKITSRTSFEVLTAVLRLRWNEEATRRFLRFATVGGIGFIVNALALELFAQLQVLSRLADIVDRASPPRIFRFAAQKSSWAAGFAAEIAILNNFLLNNAWTFRRFRPGRVVQFVLNALKFNLTSIGAALIQFVTIGTATLLFSESTVVRQITLIFTVLFLVIPYNWFMYNKVIWKTHQRHSHPNSSDSYC